MSAVTARLDSSAEAAVDGSAWTFSGAFNSPGAGAVAAAAVVSGAAVVGATTGAAAGAGAVAAARGFASSARTAAVTANKLNATVPINNLMLTLLVAKVSIAARAAGVCPRLSWPSQKAVSAGRLRWPSQMAFAGSMTRPAKSSVLVGW